MLDGNVFLPTKATSYEHRLHNHTLRRLIPAEHVRDLLARVVGALVGAANLDAVLIGEGHSALRLQEGMLGERRLKRLGDRVGRLGKGLLRIATNHMAALANVSRRLLMHERRPLSAGLLNGTHRLQRLVVYLDKLLCRGKRIPVLSDHQTQDVAHEAGDTALSDHDVPVLLDVAHFVHGNIRRFEDPYDAR